MISDFKVTYSFAVVELAGLLSFLVVVFDKRCKDEIDSKSLQFLAGDSPVDEVKKSFCGSLGLVAFVLVNSLVVFGGSFSC